MGKKVRSEVGIARKIVDEIKGFIGETFAIFLFMMKIFAQAGICLVLIGATVAGYFFSAQAIAWWTGPSTIKERYPGLITIDHNPPFHLVIQPDYFVDRPVGFLDAQMTVLALFAPAIVIALIVLAIWISRVSKHDAVSSEALQDDAPTGPIDSRRLKSAVADPYEWAKLSEPNASPRHASSS